jgi:hypothetical protein
MSPEFVCLCLSYNVRNRGAPQPKSVFHFLLDTSLLNYIDHPHIGFLSSSTVRKELKPLKALKIHKYRRFIIYIETLTNLGHKF